MNELELIFFAGSSLLEGPVWDPIQKVIYCVSIEQNLIYQINPITGKVSSYSTDGNVGCVGLNVDGSLISAEKNGIYRIDTKTGERTYITQFSTDINVRYNDGKFDPIGRFIVGTKSERDFFNLNEDITIKGSLYSYHNGDCKVLLNDLGISNGIGFSTDGTKMYFIDTPTKKVAQFKYDIETGDILFEKYIVEIDGPGWPDGMCVDTDGNIWVAEWGGSRVRKWNIHTSEVMSEVILPCTRVTSCCLGGDDFGELFITTAKNKNDIFGGALFRKKIK
jgi:sugar lactone lactonase YvrE